MRTFIRQCFCQKNGAEFISKDNFDASSIDELYCPFCSDRAALGSVLLDLQEAYDQPVGVWAIKFSNAALKTQDKKFIDNDNYFINLLRNKMITFKFLKDDPNHHIVNILGIKKTPRERLEEKQIEKDLRNKHRPKARKKL